MQLVSQEKWRKENIGLMDSFLKLETILGAKNEEIMQKQEQAPMDVKTNQNRENNPITIEN